MKTPPHYRHYLRYNLRIWCRFQEKENLQQIWRIAMEFAVYSIEKWLKCWSMSCYPQNTKLTHLCDTVDRQSKRKRLKMENFEWTKKNSQSYSVTTDACLFIDISTCKKSIKKRIYEKDLREWDRGTIHPQRTVYVLTQTPKIVRI